MTRRAPPLRFLVLVVGGWIAIRATLYAPSWWAEPGVAAPARRPVAAAGPRPTVPPDPDPAVFAAERSPARGASTAPSPTVALALAPVTPPGPLLRPTLADPPLAGPVDFTAPRAVDGQADPIARPAPARPPGRWSMSAWLLVRGERAPPLAPGGTLGGSQAGLRLSYRLDDDAARPLSLAARLYSPLGNRAGAEVALGLDWRPVAGVPLNILAERRQALGRAGRSAFALGLHGGLHDAPLPGGLRLDAYAQAGIVGARSRDLFADASARVSVPVGRLRIGGGIWGGAQPGAARLDLGPQASLPLPLAGERVRLGLEYRFRIAGEASPASGPVLTLGSDF